MQTFAVKEKAPSVIGKQPFGLNHNAVNSAVNCQSNKGSFLSNPYGLQAKLKIGQPNDKYEQEADKVADQIMRMSDNETLQTKYSHIPNPKTMYGMRQ